MASPLFHHCLLQQLSAELGVGVHLLRSLGLVLQLAQLEPQRRVHAAELAAPLRVRRRADAEPRHTSGTGGTGFGALGHGYDLAVGEAGLLDGNLLESGYEKIPRLGPAIRSGHYQPTVLSHLAAC
jgi:hypothetical protein